MTAQQRYPVLTLVAVAAAAPTYWTFALALVPVGLTALTALTTANAMVQTRVAPEMRGRVMSIYTLAFFGLMPFGSFIAGRLAEQIGEPATVVAGATVLLGTALWIRLRVPEVSAAS